jgi:RNA polymerase sigma-70 factor (ECF subfamily)
LDYSKALAEVDDAELVQRASQGRDEEAFAELMRRHASTSFRLALSILRDRHEAEDQVQNSFFKAWKHLSGFQFESRFSTWFRKIVVNQSLMRLRVVRRVAFHPLEESNEFSSERPRQYAADEPSHEQDLSQDQIFAHLRAEIKKLPPLLREVLILRDLEERSVEEIAAQLGITESAVKSRLARARPMLRERMERYVKPLMSEGWRPAS